MRQKIHSSAALFGRVLTDSFYLKDRQGGLVSFDLDVSREGPDLCRKVPNRRSIFSWLPRAQRWIGRA